MKFNLRTLVLIMALAPPLATAGHWSRDPAWSVHRAAGALAVASYTLAVLLLAAVYYRTKDWKRPPKKTPLLWTAVLASVVSAGAGAVFFGTFSEESHPVDRDALQFQSSFPNRMRRKTTKVVVPRPK